MKVISLLNLKGGVAKTFTAVNMAYELYRRGYKVLLLDNDKQGNLSKTYGRYDAESIAPITKLLSGEWTRVTELINHTNYAGVDIVSANMSLMGATWQLTAAETGNQIERYKRLIQAVGSNYYDYCIIDNPPDIGLNVVNALVVTDEVIVPVKIDEWALEGLDILADQIEDAKQFNPALRLLGVLVTAYQNTDGEVAGREWLETEKNSYSLLGVIRYSGKVAESTFLFKPIYEYSPCCGAAQDYKKFVTAYTGKAR
ncbi:MAG: ParA family protein [Lachnospiraceae bacterium]|nr:ParA family protein [Lachnospiraceae bacterium]